MPKSQLSREQQPYPNMLGALIDRSGYSFTEVAEKAQMSRRTLHYWASGATAIKPECRIKLAEIIGCDPHDLVPMSMPLVSQSKLSAEFMALLEADIADQWDLYYTMGAGRVASGIEEKLGGLLRFTHSADETEWHYRLRVLLTMGYQLQSCVQRDLMNYKKSHIAYQQAFQVAQELDDSELMASSLARDGVTLIQQDKAQEAIIFLVGARNILDRDIYPCLCGNILQGLSEAYAKFNQPLESWKCIEQAEKMLAYNGSTHERSLIRGVTTASIAAQKGVNAVLLKDYHRAIDLIDEGLKTYHPAFLRGRARLQAQKAEAYFGIGDLDACTHFVQKALYLGEKAGSNKTIARIRTLYTGLSQSHWRKEQCVLQIGEALKRTDEKDTSYLALRN